MTRDERRLERMRRFQVEYGRPMSAAELAHAMGWSRGGAENFLGRMRRFGLVDDQGRVVA